MRGEGAHQVIRQGLLSFSARILCWGHTVIFTSSMSKTSGRSCCIFPVREIQAGKHLCHLRAKCTGLEAAGHSSCSRVGRVHAWPEK